MRRGMYRPSSISSQAGRFRLDFVAEMRRRFEPVLQVAWQVPSYSLLACDVGLLCFRRHDFDLDFPALGGRHPRAVGFAAIRRQVGGP